MFDPYYKWLGIPPQDQPPNHYRLLSLQLYEKDLDVIEGAADRAMAFVRQYQSGEHAGVAARLLNEISNARLCLLKPKSKSDYDAGLKRKLAPKPTPKVETPSFADDADITELLKSSKAIPKKKKKPVKTLPMNYLIGGGIGAIMLVLLVVIAVSSGRQQAGPQVANSEPVKDAPTTAVENTVKPMETHVPIKEPTPISKPAAPASSSTTSSTQPAAPEATSSTTSKEAPLFQPPAVQDASGPSVDLIEGVNLKRDTYAGEWKKEGTSLVGGNGSSIYLPTRLPDDYQLRFQIKRIADNDTLLLGFVMAGRPGLVAIDAFNATCSGLYLDGREPNNNTTSHPGGLFQSNRSSTIDMTVHVGHLNVSFDGQTIIDWYGTPDRLFTNSSLNIPSLGTAFIGMVRASYRIESAVMTPIQAEPETERVTKLDGTLDLMPRLNMEEDSKHGDWTLRNHLLQSPNTKYAQINLPVPVPQEYTFSTTIELPTTSQGDPSIVTGLIAGNSYFTLTLKNDNCLGIEKIDGLRWDINETRVSGPFLVPGKPVKMSTTVTRNAIRVDLDGKEVIHWAGDFRRLSVQDDWAPFDGRKLYIGTMTSFKIHDLELGPPVDSPSTPPHQEFKVGRPVDLLAIINPKRDAVDGVWERIGTGIRVMGSGGPYSKLVVPSEVPPEYKLTIRVTREPGGSLEKETLMLKLPTPSSMANVVLDGWGSTISAAAIDRISVNDPKNNSLNKVQVMPVGQSVELVVTVRETGLKIMKGKKTIIDWTGNPNRFYQEPMWATPIGRIALCSDHVRFRFDKLEMEPLEPTSDLGIPELGADGNLLAIIDTARDSRKGQWTRTADGLVSPMFEGHRLTVPVVPPERYVITADVERRKGTYELSFGLVVGGQPCNVVIDGGLSKTGLELVDNRQFDERLNLTQQDWPQPHLEKGKRVKVRCFVLRDAVLLMCDDHEVAKWHGDPRRLSLRPLYLPPNYSETDRKQLWLGGWDSEFLIRELTLKPLSDEEAKWVLSKTDGS